MDFIFFKTDNQSGYKTRESWVMKNLPEFYNDLNSYCDGLDDSLTFKEKLLFYFEKRTSRPKCLTCGGEIKFRDRFDKPYGDFCSLLCINNNKDEMLNRIKKTMNQKYSVDYFPQHNEFVEKQKKTKKLKYGSGNYNNQTKTKETKKNKHGDENYNNITKMKETVLEKYGTDNISKSKYYKLINDNIFKEKYPNLNILNIDKNLITIRCDSCDSEYSTTKQLIYERNKRGYEICNICNPIGHKNKSGYETEINDFMNSIGVETVTSYRELPNKLEIDIFVPDKRIGIEFNGLYWHNELFKSNDYHLNKHKLCLEKNIELIQIFEDEWLFKKEIVKSIIKNKLGLISEKIYSRKCELREVDNKTSKMFLDENHIQGNVKSKIKIGLFYENELVSLMTFSKGRVIVGGKPDEWELTRFCNKKDLNVIGSASKLFTFFKKNYIPKKIISYSDNRLFNGNIYKKLGFSYCGESKPNYWYVINNLRYYRFNFRKSQLVKEGYDNSKTEEEIMFERKIYRIYDCGNKRWEYV